MAKYVFYPGIPFSFKYGFIPVVPSVVVGKSNETYEVSVDTDFDIPYPDDNDWQKGGGFSFNLFNNHEDSVMWVFRILNHKVQYSSYAHVDGVIIKEDHNVFEAVLGEKVRIHIYINEEDRTYNLTFSGRGKKTITHKIPFKHDKCCNLMKTINPWFECQIIDCPPNKVTLNIVKP